MVKNNWLKKGYVLLCVLLISLLAFSQQQNIPQQNTTTLTNEDLATPGGPGKGEPASSTSASQEEKSEPAQEGQVSYYIPPTPKKSQEIASASASEITDLLAKPIFQQKVTLIFKDADLQDVIRLIARKTGINVIMSKDVVKGTLTVQLEDVPLGVALDVILKTNNLGYVLEKGDIIRIVPRKMVQIKPVEVETRLFPINWVPVSELRKSLEPFLSEHGEIHEHKDSNALIITDTPPNIRVFEDLISRLDKPQRQVMIEAILANIDEKAFRQLSTGWDLLEDGIGVSGFPSPEESVRYIIPENVIDGMRAVLGSNGLNIDAREMGRIFGTKFKIRFILNALENRSEATVLAAPRVITLNNQPARIDITKDNPYFEAIEKEGGQIRHTVKFKESGIKLIVTPYITENGYVRMNIRPEHEVIVGDVGGVPVIDKRTFEVNVIVRDEQTVCLGGFRQHDHSESDAGVPFLQKIPVLHWLFKGRNYRIDKSQIVLFVTPSIVKKPELTELEKYQKDWINNVWELPDEFFEEYPVIPKEYKDLETITYGQSEK